MGTIFLIGFYEFMVISVLFYSTLGLETVEKAKKHSLKFFVMGDWGGLPFFPYTTFVEVAVARKMGDLADKHKADFILALGDNFYLKGVENVEDARFQETFENVFASSSLQIPWFVVAGNHDHYGNVSAQISYTKKSKRWFFPDYYYKKSFVIPSSNCTVDIIMIDTIILCGNTDPNNPYAPPMYGTRNKCQAMQHWKWIEKQLETSRADYILVCGHYPVYSIAEHGSTKCLVEKLLPLLERYHVNAYFSGHDHNLQHIQPFNRNWTVNYFISGSANFIDPSKKNIKTIPPNSLKFHWANPFTLGGFIYVEATKVNMTVFLTESNGKLLYKYSFVPQSK